MATKKTEKVVANMIKDIINIGRDTATVNKFGRKWTFKLVSAEDYLKVLKATSEYERDEMARYFKMELEILKYAVIEIDDIALDEDDKDMLFNNLNPNIIGILFNEFETVRSQKDKELTDMDAKSKIVMKQDADVEENTSTEE